jgi:hypothetical protein
MAASYGDPGPTRSGSNDRPNGSGFAGFALPFGMPLAGLYALSGRLGVTLSIETMAETHAMINLFGFALPSSLAWLAWKRAARRLP